MRIGVDIDGVLTNIEQFTLDYITKFCVENNIEYQVKASSYSPYEAFNITKEQEDEFWNKYLFNYAKEEPVRPFAAEVINLLKDEGHEIYIITSRWLTNRDDELGNTMRKIVKNWLEENKISYDNLIFAKASKERKVQEITDYAIDLMIEDSPNNITELSKIIPVVCYNTGYNTQCIGDNIIRCYSWYDIYKTIININK